MRLTPLDIRKQEFSHKLRGYDADEVHAFLQMLANQWEELQDENRRREEKIRELDGKLRHYEKVEEALQEALQTARESSRKTLKHAEEKAELMIDQAEARADEIRREAERERHDLKRETVKLSGRRSEIVTRLRAFLMSEMELLARYEGDDPVGFIKLLPMDEGTMRRLSDRPGETRSSEMDLPEEPDLQLGDTSWPESARQDDVGAGEARHEGSSAIPPNARPEAAPRRDAHDEFDSGVGREAPPPRERQAHSASPPDEASSREMPRGAEPDWSASRDEEDRHHGFEGTPEAEPPSDHEPEGEDVIEGPGWTARTVVSRPSEQQGPPPGARPSPNYDEEEGEDETRTRATSEEIEKIRRILSDLD